MMFGHELIESLHFIAPHRPCVQMDENLLFIGCGLAKGGDFFLFHVRQHKKLRPACPAKSFNAFPFSGFPLPKNAPYYGPTCLSKRRTAGAHRSRAPSIPASVLHWHYVPGSRPIGGSA